MALEEAIYALLQSVDGKLDALSTQVSDLSDQLSAVQDGSDTLGSIAVQVTGVANQITALQGGAVTLESLSSQIDDLATTPPEIINEFIAAMNKNYGLNLTL